MTWGCEVPTQNHSDDIIEVYRGEATPFILCGYHASQDATRIGELVRAARAEVRTCRDCGAPVEVVADVGWVDARSGDVGGTYDICPARFDAQTDGPRGHRVL